MSDDILKRLRDYKPFFRHEVRGAFLHEVADHIQTLEMERDWLREELKKIREKE